jgi:hypothetical protein
MKTNFRIFFLSLLMAVSFLTYSQQTEEIKLNAEKVKMYTPYMQFKHGGPEGYPVWKNNNKMQYTKEMWYYTESFYVKRNHLSEGVVLNEEIIDISRFENQRKQNEEAIVILPGFKDVLVLIPANKLIYKP